MVNLTSSGNFNHTEDFLKRIKDGKIQEVLTKAGEEGVKALRAATPKDSGVTASSWTYEIEQSGGGYTIQWINTNFNMNVNIAVIIQMGHGTRNGGYVQGIDYINPAMKPTFDKIVEDVWREVTKP